MYREISILTRFPNYWDISERDQHMSTDCYWPFNEDGKVYKYSEMGCNWGAKLLFS